MARPDLDDGALSIFAFAAYHQLESGQAVTRVIRRDGKGHKADEAGVAVLVEHDLAEIRGEDVAFTPAGLAVLGRAIEGLRNAAA